MGSYFEKYMDRRNQYRWRLRDGNHKIIADSAEAYVSKWNLDRAIENVRRSVPSAKTVDNT
jgi:uncharacterized protein YegP (UPF0339 family)